MCVCVCVIHPQTDPPTARKPPTQVQTKSMLKYREFLETLVAENQRDYTDIDDVTGKRYPTLLHAYEQLLEAERLAGADVEAKTEELKSLESQRQNAVLTKTSQVCVCVCVCVCQRCVCVTSRCVCV